MADDFRPGDDDRIAQSEAAEPERYGRRGRRIMTTLVAVAAILGFGVVMVYAYNKGRQDGADKAPPIIAAKEGPSKIRPENPGGMNVPNQDKEVFSRLEADKPSTGVERLLPPPEKPMTPPSPPAAAVEELAKTAPAAGAETPQAAAKPADEPASAPPAAPKDVKQLAAKPPKAPPPAPKKAEKKPEPKKTAARTPAKPKPAAKPASGRYLVQMASLKSRSAVQKNWASLKKRHADLLGKHGLRIQTIQLGGGRGTYYRMQAGPLASRPQAQALCASLKKRKQNCIVVRR